MYKVFFEGNDIRNSLEAGVKPDLPQLVDASAIVTIFEKQGVLFGIIAGLFFLIPISLSNLKLIGSKNKWVNMLCFCVGLLVFDVLVSTMVAMNTDEIKSLIDGRKSQMQIWEVVKHGEFWLIFTFGMLPLAITHFIIDFIVNAYQKSNREIVDAEKNKQIETLEKEILDLTMGKDFINNKIKAIDDSLKLKNEEILRLERELNSLKNQMESKSAELLKNVKAIYEDFMAKITSGKIFTEEILNSVTSVYKAGYIDYLPELYAEKEVENRVREIEQVIKNYF